jgi:hypothetical protein
MRRTDRDRFDKERRDARLGVFVVVGFLVIFWGSIIWAWYM